VIAKAQRNEWEAFQQDKVPCALEPHTAFELDQVVQYTC